MGNKGATTTTSALTKVQVSILSQAFVVDAQASVELDEVKVGEIGSSYAKKKQFRDTRWRYEGHGMSSAPRWGLTKLSSMGGTLFFLQLLKILLTKMLP